MTSASVPAPVEAAAPALAAEFARRFGLIMAGLAAVVAHRFLKDPRFVALIVPLWTRLHRAAGRCSRLMARLAANRLRKPGKPRPDRPTPDQARATRFPTGQAWLVRVLGYEAAAYACQLEALLAEPGVAGLLAACPAAGRILRPLARMLGVRSPALNNDTPKPRARRRRAPARVPEAAPLPAAPPRAPAVPLPPGHPCATYRPSARWPAACRLPPSRRSRLTHRALARAKCFDIKSNFRQPACRDPALDSKRMRNWGLTGPGRALSSRLAGALGSERWRRMPPTRRLIFLTGRTGAIALAADRQPERAPSAELCCRRAERLPRLPVSGSSPA